MLELLASLVDGSVVREVEPIDSVVLILTVDSKSATLSRGPDARPLLDFAYELADVVAQVPRNRPSWERLLSKARRARAFVMDDLTAATRITLSMGKPIGPLPLDLGMTDVEDRRVLFVAGSAAEVVRAAALDAPTTAGVLELPDSPLRTRHALVPLALVEPERQQALRDDVARRIAEGVAVPTAVQSALRDLRAAWKPAGPPHVPVWAALVLRGAR
jgi:hypothetical protein